jgi:hypothetical protein
MDFQFRMNFFPSRLESTLQRTLNDRVAFEKPLRVTIAEDEAERAVASDRSAVAMVEAHLAEIEVDEGSNNQRFEFTKTSKQTNKQTNQLITASQFALKTLTGSAKTAGIFSRRKWIGDWKRRRLRSSFASTRYAVSGLE